MPNNTINKIPVVPRYKALLNLRPFVKNPIKILDNYNIEYGSTYEIFMGGIERAIITSNPNIIRHILQKNHRNYQKSHIQRNALGRFLGNGLLTSEGDYWLRQRRLIQPGFHKNKLEALSKIMIAVITEFFNKLDKKIEKQSQIDLYELMMELAFITVAKSLFNTSMSDNELGKLSTNLTKLQEFIIKQIRMPFLAPWLRLSGALAKHDQMAAESKALVLKYIKKRRQSKEEQDDLLDMLLAARYEDNGEGMTDEQILDEALILFIAGHETTANALSWMGYLLTQHPESIQQIRAELKENVSNNIPTFEDIPKLNYLRQVIEESMRLYPPAWITDRFALEDDVVDGFKIKKGKLVVPYIYGVHRSPELWDQPDAFLPKRFETGAKKNHIPFAYLPFGGGPRLCIGNGFAIMEMQLIMAIFIQKYDFDLCANKPVSMKPLVTLRPKDGVFITMRPHKTDA